MRKSTEVGMSNATIKRIVTATVGVFKGRKVSVVEVGSNFAYDIYLEMGSPEVAYFASPRGDRAQELPRPSMSRPTTTIRYEAFAPLNLCLVVHHRGQSASVTIYVPELDAGALSVATDALIEKDKRKAAAALTHCGAYEGIAMAVAEAHAKTLAKSASGTTPKKSVKRLEAEIEALIGRRL